MNITKYILIIDTYGKEKKCKLRVLTSPEVVEKDKCYTMKDYDYEFGKRLLKSDMNKVVKQYGDYHYFTTNDTKEERQHFKDLCKEIFKCDIKELEKRVAEKKDIMERMLKEENFVKGK